MADEIIQLTSPLASSYDVAMAKVKAGKGRRAPKPIAKAKPIARAKPSRRKAAAARPALLAPEVSVLVLYDLICSVEDELETSLAFGICEQKARDHNDANPGHDAQPIRRQ